MIICEMTDQLMSLIKRDEIANLNLLSAYGLKDEPNYHIEVLVDNLNDPNGIMIRENQYWHYIYALNERFLKTAKDYFDTLDEYGVDACDKRVYEYMVLDRKIDWEEHCILHYHDDSIDESLNLDSIQIEDAEIINDHYTYKDEESLDQIKENILRRPSSIYRIDGQPVAWVMMHRDGSVGIMYVQEAYRKLGLAYKLSLDIIEKVKKQNKIPFIHINVNNDASLKLAKKVGFKRYKDVFWYGIKNS